MIIRPPNPSLSDPHGDAVAVSAFLDHFSIRPRLNDLKTLGDVGEAFSTLPYENISKILAASTGSGPDDWRRKPKTVVTEHIAHGLGGTCFSLTQTLALVAASLGYAAAPVMADTPAGADRHCALLVRVGDRDCLLDPGYLINEPLPIPDTISTLETPRGPIHLERNLAAHTLTLWDTSKGQRRTRYTLRLRPASEREFLRAWDASFTWPTMRSLVVTRHDTKGQIYLHGRHLRLIGRETVTKENLKTDLETRVSQLFALDPEKVRAALERLEAARRAP